MTLVLDMAPTVRPGQTVALILGDREIVAEPTSVPASRLTFRMADAAAPGSSLLVRLRVDGFESPIIDRTVTPSRFLDRRITLP